MRVLIILKSGTEIECEVDEVPLMKEEFLTFVSKDRRTYSIRGSEVAALISGKAIRSKEIRA